MRRSSTSAPSGLPTAPPARSKSRSTPTRRPLPCTADGQKIAEQTGEHVFTFKVPLTGEVKLQAVAGECIDTASFRKVDTPNPGYKLVKTKSKSANWV